MDWGELIPQLGLAGIIIVFFLKEMFAYLRARDEERQSTSAPSNGITLRMNDILAICRKLDSQIRDLYNWHNVKDRDNVPVWYVRETLENNVKDLTAAIEAMAKAAKEQSETLDEALESVAVELHALCDSVKKGQGHD